jgi:bacterioferritin (cytochrome b1)
MSQADARRDAGKPLLARHSITSSARHSFEDYVARDTFGEPRHDEEEHIDFSETQLHLVAKVGLESLCLAPHRKA